MAENLLDIFNSLREEGTDTSSIIQNIFLNYNAYRDNNLIYTLKKAISNEFHIDFNNVKLIGSAHTGFNKKTGSLKSVITPNDFDFAIIDSKLFSDILLSIDFSQVNPEATDCFKNNIIKGKLHILYTSNAVKTDINNRIQKAISRTGTIVEKKVTICVYPSEEAFLKNQEEYFSRLISSDLKQYSKKSTSINTQLKDKLKDFKFN